MAAYRLVVVSLPLFVIPQPPTRQSSMVSSQDAPCGAGSPRLNKPGQKPKSCKAKRILPVFEIEKRETAIQDGKDARKSLRSGRNP
jgi:hypothetical protein